MKKIVLFLSILVCLGFAQIQVVTTLPDFKNIVEIIGGNKVQVTALIKGTQDPHHYEIKPSDILTLRRADVVVLNGAELDEYWLLPLLEKSRNSRIQKGSPAYIDASSGLTLLEIPTGKIDRSMGDVHPAGNPHYTLSPTMMRQVVLHIAQQLAVLYPEYATEFKANTNAYVQELDRHIAQWKQQVQQVAPIVVYHNSWTYFFADFGLSAVGYIEPKPGISPSPEHMAQLIATMREHPHGLVLQEVYENGDNARFVAEQANYRHVVVPTLVGGTSSATDYIHLIDTLITTIAQSEKKQIK